MATPATQVRHDGGYTYNLFKMRLLYADSTQRRSPLPLRHQQALQSRDHALDLLL